MHGYLLSTYRSRCGIRILSAMVWSQGGADYTLSALFRSTITGVVARGFRSSSVPVTHEGYLIESHRPLLPSLGPHKLIALSLSVTQHINNQPPSFLTVFKSLLRWFQLFSLSVLLVMSLEQKWLHEPTCNIEILHPTQMGQDVYIYGIRTYQTYIYI